jgi:DNA adenine methylase
MNKIYVPPLKIQGKKTQLVPFIKQHLPNEPFTTWIEPFMGSGVVGFNVQPKKAIFADSNPHIINFYQAMQRKEITPLVARQYLQEQGKILAEKGQVHYNEIRERFNHQHQPLDFLFLNRSCFNGMIRFNRNLRFNVPYGHKPERFAPAYITKIANQIKQIAFLIDTNEWEFVCQPFDLSIQMAQPNDLIYCDPPYIGRHVDYYDSWSETEELLLAQKLQESKAKFMVSTWHSTSYRQNTYLQTTWQQYNVVTTSHFYHLGAKETNRNAVTEALITNYVEPPKNTQITPKTTLQQLALPL